MNEIAISGTITADLDDLFFCIKALSLIEDNLVSIKHRIFGEEINYEDDKISIYVNLYKNGVEKRNDYLFDCNFSETENDVESFLLELSNLLENKNAIYSFEYTKSGQGIEINNYAE